MKPLSLVCLAAAAMALAGGAHAQSYRDDVRYENDDPYVRDGGYDYARVVRVDPLIVRDSANGGGQRCYDRPAQDGYGNGGDYYGDGQGSYGAGTANPQGRGLATVIGGVVGAVAGSRFGGGSGQLLGTAVGTMVGGVAGRSVYDANHPVDRQGTVRVCDPVPYEERERVDGYDVTYEYAGRTYRTHSDYNPGERIRIRIEPAPE
ncbi:MAG TPA: glycine zipper 2TM domain-containing protein [Stenotrophomonas sp.]|jgi:uncharacterized protein YcfJ